MAQGHRAAVLERGLPALSAETRKHLDRENEQLKVILTELGLAKQ